MAESDTHSNNLNFDNNRESKEDSVSSNENELLIKINSEVTSEKWTKKQRMLLLLSSLACLSFVQAMSLFPPFYPRIAEKKGAGSSIYGVVLGSNCLVMCLSAPIFGKHIANLGVAFVFTSGVFVNGVCCLLTGFLDQMPNGATFILMSLGIRTFNAAGNAGVLTSSYVILTAAYPGTPGKVFVLIRIILNGGLFIGPIVGGALFQIDGYRLPFLVLGTVQCLIVLLSPFFDLNKITMVETQSTISFCKLFKIKFIWISLTCYFVSSLTSGYLSVSLEPQILRKYMLEPFLMGVLFGIKDGSCGLFALLWTYLCYKIKIPKLFMGISSVISIIALLLLNVLILNPSTFSYSLGIIVTGLLANGIGVSGQQVASFNNFMLEVAKAGSISNKWLAGLWPSLNALGFFAQSLFGILVEHFGHSAATLTVVGLNTFLIILIALFSWKGCGTEDSVQLQGEIRNTCANESDQIQNAFNNSVMLTL